MEYYFMLSYLGDFFRGDIDFLEVIIYLGSICFVIFCATPLHEFAHALAAVKLGDDTPRLRGRLTINPMAHIDLIGALMIFLVGFGYAKPVEVRMRHFKKPKRDMALVALAGPVCNIIQAFVCLLLINALRAFLPLTETLQHICMFFLYAALINVNLAVFNLIPIPPLDGSRLLTALLPSKYYYKLMQYERYFTIGLYVLMFTGILSVPLSLLSNLVINGLLFVTGLPFSFIG